MKRGAVVALSLLACSSVPAFAQSNSELAGAPGWRTAEQDAAKRAAARKQVEDQIAQARAQTRKLQADQAAAARKAGDKKAEEARRAKQAELRDLESRLKAKQQELAAEEERLAKLRAEIEDGPETAEAPAGRPTPPLDGPPLDEPPLESAARDERPGFMRLDASIQSCAFAGEDKALSRDYISARYVRPPRFFERRNAFDGIWELRGVMRVEDWRGALLADTVCELDEDGEVLYFAFLR